LIKRPTLDFSFAGLKTAVLTQVKKLEGEGPMNDTTKADVAASVQAAIVEVLVSKCARAIQETGIRQLVVAGGVSANQELRRQLAIMQGELNAKVMFPAPSLCTDNGVMIAWAAGLRLLNGTQPQAAGSFNVQPRWPLA
jgi:N6-L-threonylcarbamoyladenine synthase